MPTADDVRHAILIQIATLGARSEPGDDGLPPPDVREEMARLRALLDDGARLKEIAESSRG